MIQITIPVKALGKPRMTRSDSWKKRKCVVNYWEYSDKLKEAVKGIDLTDIDIVSWVAYFPFPKSYSKKKRASLLGRPHKQKPDRDNIDKGILDSLFKDDSHIFCGSISKYWDDGDGARIDLVLFNSKKLWFYKDMSGKTRT